MNYKSSNNKHLEKKITHNVINTCIWFLPIWYITGNVMISILFGVIEIWLKPLIYSFYEKKWGKPIKVNVINEVKIVKPEVKEHQENIIETIKQQLSPHVPPPTKMLREVENPEKKIKKVLNYTSNR